METNTIIMFIAFAFALVFLAYRVSDQDDQIRAVKKRFAASFTLTENRPHVEKLQELAAAIDKRMSDNRTAEKIKILNFELGELRSKFKASRLDYYAVRDELRKAKTVIRIQDNSVSELDAKYLKAEKTIANNNFDLDGYKLREEKMTAEIEKLKAETKIDKTTMQLQAKKITELKLENESRYGLIWRTLRDLKEAFPEVGPVQICKIGGDLEKFIADEKAGAEKSNANPDRIIEAFKNDNNNRRFMPINVMSAELYPDGPDFPNEVNKTLCPRCEGDGIVTVDVEDMKYEQTCDFCCGTGEIETAEPQKPEKVRENVPQFKTAKLRRAYESFETTVYVPADTNVNDKQAVYESEIKTCDCPSCKGTGEVRVGPSQKLSECLDCEGLGKLFIMQTGVGEFKYKKSAAERRLNQIRTAEPYKQTTTLTVNVDTPGIKEAIEKAKAEVRKETGDKLEKANDLLNRAYCRLSRGISYPKYCKTLSDQIKEHLISAGWKSEELKETNIVKAPAPQKPSERKESAQPKKRSAKAVERKKDRQVYLEWWNSLEEADRDGLMEKYRDKNLTIDKNLKYIYEMEELREAPEE